MPEYGPFLRCFFETGNLYRKPPIDSSVRSHWDGRTARHAHRAAPRISDQRFPADNSVSNDITAMPELRRPCSNRIRPAAGVQTVASVLLRHATCCRLSGTHRGNPVSPGARAGDDRAAARRLRVPDGSGGSFGLDDDCPPGNRTTMPLRLLSTKGQALPGQTAAGKTVELWAGGAQTFGRRASVQASSTGTLAEGMLGPVGRLPTAPLSRPHRLQSPRRPGARSLVRGDGGIRLDRGQRGKISHYRSAWSATGESRAISAQLD